MLVPLHCYIGVTVDWAVNPTSLGSVSLVITWWIGCYFCIKAATGHVFSMQTANEQGLMSQSYPILPILVQLDQKGCAVSNGEVEQEALEGEGGLNRPALLQTSCPAMRRLGLAQAISQVRGETGSIMLQISCYMAVSCYLLLLVRQVFCCPTFSLSLLEPFLFPLAFLHVLR